MCGGGKQARRRAREQQRREEEEEQRREEEEAEQRLEQERRQRQKQQQPRPQPPPPEPTRRDKQRSRGGQGAQSSKQRKTTSGANTNKAGDQQRSTFSGGHSDGQSAMMTKAEGGDKSGNTRASRPTKSAGAGANSTDTLIKPPDIKSADTAANATATEQVKRATPTGTNKSKRRPSRLVPGHVTIRSPSYGSSIEERSVFRKSPHVPGGGTDASVNKREPSTLTGLPLPPPPPPPLPPSDQDKEQQDQTQKDGKSGDKPKEMSQ